MRRKFCLFMVCLLVVMSILGCGNSEGAQREAKTETEAKSTAGTVKSAAEAGTCAALETEADESDEDIDEIVVAFPMVGPHTQAAVDRVTDAINAVTVPEIRTSVTLLPVELASYGQQMSLRLSANEQLDLMPTFYFGPTTFPAMMAQKQLLPLDDLLGEYGQDIVSLLPDYFLKTTTFDGSIYAVPAYKDLVSNVYICMRKDILAEIGMEDQAENIRSLDDLENIYKVVKEKTEIRPVGCDTSVGVMAYLPVLLENDFSKGVHYDDVLADMAAVLEDAPDKVVSLFETDAFENVCRRTRQWYEQGYIYINESGDMAQTYPNCFSIFLAAENATYMSGLAQAMSMGYEYEVVKIASGMVTTSAVNTIDWVIPVSSKRPEAAMKFMNLMYTNKTIIDLLNYGQEDIDYIVLEDGTYDFPEGINAGNSQYHDNLSWLFGNQYLSGVWTGSDPEIRKTSAQINEDPLCSPLLGFTVNTTGLETEIAALGNVYNEFFKSLSSGTVDVDTELPKFRQKLKDNGIDKVVESVQQQLDAWMAE